VEHWDRLARLAVEHLEAALSGQGRPVMVLDAAETTDDLVRDMIELLTTACPVVWGPWCTQPCDTRTDRHQG
jgi:putative resolvase